MGWRPWEKKKTGQEGRIITMTEQELDRRVLLRAEELAKQIMAGLPRPTTEHVVRFSDLLEVEGYVVHERHPPYELRKPLIVTDDRERALACMRRDPKARFLKVARLWKTPSGTLLWKVEAQVAWPATVDVDG